WGVDRPARAGGRFGWGHRSGCAEFEMDQLKRMLAIPQVKYGLLTLGTGVWTVGLVEQLYSSAATMKYLLMSLLVVAVAILERYGCQPPIDFRRSPALLRGLMSRWPILLAWMLVAQPAWAQPEPTRAPAQPSWYASALKFVPPGHVAGYAIRADDK